MTDRKPISFARGAPSLDIIDVEGLKAAAQAAFTADPAGPHRLRDLGWLRAAASVDRRQARRARRRTWSSPTARCRLTRSCSTRWWQGDTVVVEMPTYDRTLLALRNRGADVRMVALEPEGSTWRRSSVC